MRKLTSILIIIFSFCFIYCQNSKETKFSPRVQKIFKTMTQSYEEGDEALYNHCCYELINAIEDSIEAREAILYYFFEYPYNEEILLFKIQGEEKYGFYEDWEILDRFYDRYQKKYTREKVEKDGNLLRVHQAYIQILSVCNYEKIKPLYLQELSETIRNGDYTYAFNSYLLPEHWTEAADTLIKYYWDVRDDDTREKMNRAIIKIKKEQGINHYKQVCQKDKERVVNMLMFYLYVLKVRNIKGDTFKYLSQYMKYPGLKEMYQQGIKIADE